MFFPLRDDNPSHATPFVVLGVIAVNLLAWFYELSLPADLQRELMYQAGAIPARVTGSPLTTSLDFYPVPLTLLTSLFLHGSWMHILGNMWFLWIFGDNVEDYLGRGLFLVFYLVTGLAATGTHIFLQPGDQVPVVGASGAISGVLGAYAVLYPRARIYTYVWIVIFIRRFHLPAFAFLGIWFGWQFLSLGDAGVAWWAHIGGFVAGTSIALLARAGGRKPPQPVYWD